METIRRWQQLAAQCMEFLRRDVFSMVTIPEGLAVDELNNVVDELGRYGLEIRQLIINNVVRVTDSPFLFQKAQQQRPHLERLRECFGTLSMVEIPLFPEEVYGVERLRAVGRLLWSRSP